MQKYLRLKTNSANKSVNLFKVIRHFVASKPGLSSSAGSTWGDEAVAQIYKRTGTLLFAIKL